MAVLVVTRSDDHAGVAAVIDAVQRRGKRVFRLDTDRFPTEIRLEFELDGSDHGALRTATETLALADIESVWYRRFAPAARLSRSIDPQIRQASVDEARATLLGLLTALKARHVDRWEAVRLAEHKPRQLQIARELGLAVAPTLVTNDPAAVRRFALRHPGGLLTKMLSSFAIQEGGEEKVVFTSLVGPGDLADLEGLRLCPMTFQARLDHVAALRCTIVGERVLCAGLPASARSERGAVDWRRDHQTLADRFVREELAPDVRARLIALARRLGLQYGVAELLRTPDGRHVFLELNPVGEFHWVERAAGLPIGAALADLLCGN